MKRLTQTDQGTNKIIDVVDPTGPQDAATKNYADTALATKLTASGASTITVGTSAPGSPSVGDLWVDTN